MATSRCLLTLIREKIAPDVELYEAEALDQKPSSDTYFVPRHEESGFIEEIGAPQETVHSKGWLNESLVEDTVPPQEAVYAEPFDESEIEDTVVPPDAADCEEQFEEAEFTGELDTPEVVSRRRPLFQSSHRLRWLKSRALSSRNHIVACLMTQWFFPTKPRLPPYLCFRKVLCITRQHASSLPSLPIGPGECYRLCWWDFSVGQ